MSSEMGESRNYRIEKTYMRWQKFQSRLAKEQARLDFLQAQLKSLDKRKKLLTGLLDTVASDSLLVKPEYWNQERDKLIHKISLAKMKIKEHQLSIEKKYSKLKKLATGEWEDIQEAQSGYSSPRSLSPPGTRTSGFQFARTYSQDY